MHVFIDTNILLNFFHFSKEELDSLNDVFASHEHGSACVHLTEQVCNEFKRNRETRIKDALRRFRETKFKLQFPSFMKGYEEYSEIRKLANELTDLQKNILKKVEADISANNLIADLLIEEIFETSEIIALTKKVYEKSLMRSALGNPPGKNDSIGDAVNWTMLLESVPHGEDIHIISEDGDFFSSLDEQKPHPFLDEEWVKEKNGRLHVYRTLSEFMAENFDGIAFSFDKEKEALIENLFDSGSFAQTHQIVAKLDSYRYFSAKEVMRILDAAEENDQFGGILTDYDVSDLLNRVAVPQIANLPSDEHKQKLNAIIAEQSERNRS